MEVPQCITLIRHIKTRDEPKPSANELYDERVPGSGVVHRFEAGKASHMYRGCVPVRNGYQNRQIGAHGGFFVERGERHPEL